MSVQGNLARHVDKVMLTNILFLCKQAFFVIVQSNVDKLVVPAQENLLVNGDRVTLTNLLCPRKETCSSR